MPRRKLRDKPQQGFRNTDSQNMSVTVINQLVWPGIFILCCFNSKNYPSLCIVHFTFFIAKVVYELRNWGQPLIHTQLSKVSPFTQANIMLTWNYQLSITNKFIKFWNNLLGIWKNKHSVTVVLPRFWVNTWAWRAMSFIELWPMSI